MKFTKPMYFVAIFLVNFICIDGAVTGEVVDATNPSNKIIEGFGNFVKKNIPEPYRPILEPVVDVATETINDHYTDQNLAEMGKSFTKHATEYIKQSLPSSQCVQQTLLSRQYALGITAMELGVAYILISDAAISRQVKIEKLKQLNQTHIDLYQDSRITNCLNNTSDCNLTDFNLAKAKFSRDIESKIKDVQRDINYKSNVLIPGGTIATAGALGLAGYAVYYSGVCFSSFFYSIGTGFLGYGTYQQIITNGELKDLIKKLKEVLENEQDKLKEELKKLERAINNVPSTL